MTREEMAKAAIEFGEKEGQGDANTIKNLLALCFLKGAEWANDLVIERASEWIREQYKGLNAITAELVGISTEQVVDKIIDDFKQAML